MRQRRPLILGLALGALVAGACSEASSRKPSPAISHGANPPVVRTDFSSDAAWRDLCKHAGSMPAEIRDGIAAMEAMNGRRASDIEFVDFVDNVGNAGLSGEHLCRLARANPGWGCLFVADEVTFRDPERTLLVIELGLNRRRSFRAIPSAVWAIASNLSTGNMDWEDFANHVDSDGVYRGRELVE